MTVGYFRIWFPVENNFSLVLYVPVVSIWISHNYKIWFEIWTTCIQKFSKRTDFSLTSFWHLGILIYSFWNVKDQFVIFNFLLWSPLLRSNWASFDLFLRNSFHFFVIFVLKYDKWAFHHDIGSSQKSTAIFIADLEFRTR